MNVASSQLHGWAKEEERFETARNQRRLQQDQLIKTLEEDQQKELEGLKRELHRRAKEKNKE